MIRAGCHITLRPYFTSYEDPSQNKEFIEADIDGQRVVYFQILDKNRSPETKKTTTGFCNVRIVTNAELRAWDRVVVKEIKGVKLSRGKPLLIISIIELGEKYIKSLKVEGFEDEEANDF